MNNIRLLIAEDDPHIRDGLIDTLESEGYAVEAVADGKAALDAFQQRRPDLVLLDIMMPELSGYDVCRAICRTDTRTPVILLTAKGEEIDKVVGLELGADDYVTKPFGVRELLNRVWGLTYYGTTRTLDQHIVQLRKKLKPPRTHPPPS